MILEKPNLNDLPIIENVLAQWTNQDEVKKYLQRIGDEINDRVEYNNHFWVIKYQNKTVGITGIADPLPKVKPFITNQKPIELKIMYLDNSVRGLGLGKIALTEFETIIKSLGVDQIIIRSALRYRDTAWGFYQKMGYSKVGTVDTDMAVFRKEIK